MPLGVGKHYGKKRQTFAKGPWRRPKFIPLAKWHEMNSCGPAMNASCFHPPYYHFTSSGQAAFHCSGCCDPYPDRRVEKPELCGSVLLREEKWVVLASDKMMNNHNISVTSHILWIFHIPRFQLLQVIPNLTALQSPFLAHSCVGAWLFMTMPSLTNVAPPLVDCGSIPSVTAKRKHRCNVSFSPAHPMEWLVHSCEYCQNTAISTFRIIIGTKIRPATNSAWLTVPHAFPTFDDRAAQAAQNQATKITFVLPRVEEQASSVQEIQWYIPLHCWIRGILLVAPYSSLRNWAVQYKSQTLISSKSPVWR